MRFSYGCISYQNESNFNSFDKKRKNYYINHLIEITVYFDELSKHELIYLESFLNFPVYFVKEIFSDLYKKKEKTVIILNCYILFDKLLNISSFGSFP